MQARADTLPASPGLDGEQLKPHHLGGRWCLDQRQDPGPSTGREVAAMAAAELPGRNIDHLVLPLGTPHVSERVPYPLAACGCILGPIETWAHAALHQISRLANTAFASDRCLQRRSKVTVSRCMRGSGGFLEVNISDCIETHHLSYSHLPTPWINEGPQTTRPAQVRVNVPFPVYVAASWLAWENHVLPMRSALGAWQKQQHQQHQQQEKQLPQLHQQQGRPFGQDDRQQGDGEGDSTESQVTLLRPHAREGNAATPAAGATDGTDAVSDGINLRPGGMETNSSSSSQGVASSQTGGAPVCKSALPDDRAPGNASGCKAALPDVGRGGSDRNSSPSCPRGFLVEQSEPAGAGPGTASAADSAGGDDFGISLRPGGSLGKRWGAGGAGPGTASAADNADGNDSSISLRPGGSLGKRWGAGGAHAPRATSPRWTLTAATPTAGAAIIAPTPTGKLGGGACTPSSPSKSAGAAHEAAATPRDNAAASPASVRWLTAVMEMAVSNVLAAPGTCNGPRSNDAKVDNIMADELTCEARSECCLVVICDLFSRASKLITGVNPASSNFE
eukprot:1138597-Pelagomonas_calceolata.AAC.3